MDRRNFIKCSGAAIVASQLPAVNSFAATSLNEKAPYVTYRDSGTHTLKVRFLGTGAADWNGPDERGEHRRLSSILIDDEILIDFTATAEDMIPEGISPKTIFYTHSHGDHFDPKAALAAGIETVYAGDSWISRCREEFNKYSSETGIPAPAVHPISVGQRISLANGTAVTALPGNHCTQDPGEQCLIYLVEKADIRLIYATDTGGIMGRAARIAGIDAHTEGKPITALIMEATMGIDGDEDYRIFVHSSVNTVLRTTNVLLDSGRYTPVKGQSVYLTHLARTLHGTQADLNRTLPSPLKAAHDGLEVIFR